MAETGGVRAAEHGVSLSFRPAWALLSSFFAESLCVAGCDYSAVHALSQACSSCLTEQQQHAMWQERERNSAVSPKQRTRERASQRVALCQTQDNSSSFGVSQPGMSTAHRVLETNAARAVVRGPITGGTGRGLRWALDAHR